MFQLFSVFNKFIKESGLDEPVQIKRQRRIPTSVFSAILAKQELDIFQMA